MTDTASGSLMLQEAAQAGDVIAAQFARNHAAVSALAADLRASPPPFVATCARGSSDHAATYGKALIETRLGVPVVSVSPSVSSVYGVRLQLRGALYLAISQSGRSPDLLRSVEEAKAAGARVVALVNDETSPLAAMADTLLPLCAGAERSVAATKSYLATLASLLQITTLWSQQPALLDALPQLPDALRAAWQSDWSPLVDGLVDARSLFVLGRGLGLGIAQEAALKFKETCGLHAEAFSSAEVKHGPMALVDANFPLLCFTQPDASQAGTLAMADEFRKRGAPVWVASQDANLPARLPLPVAPDPACAPVLAVQAFYRAVEALSRRRGHDPDLPPHLKKVTETV